MRVEKGSRCLVCDSSSTGASHKIAMGKGDPNFSSNVEDLEALYVLWDESRHTLKWEPPFVLPPWLNAWWKAFGTQASSYLYTARDKDGELVGFAPLVIRGNGAFFMGSEDVCDYMDFIMAPGRERDFLDLFWQDARCQGIRLLSLGSVRPDSRVAAHVVRSAEELGFEISSRTKDPSLEMDLPNSWEEYLGLLSGKQRHELRRKIRRLKEFAAVNYRVIETIEDDQGVLDLFFQLFRKSRKDKEQFLSPERESFFRAMAANMSQAGLLRIGVLDLGGNPVAALMCFDHEDVMYLYNSGFDPSYSNLSVGLVSKILCIKDSIEKGKRKFDFLKGPELYKYRLGGKEVPLESWSIRLA